MVAKSFQSMIIIGEPYKKNDRMYVDVRHPTTGNTRTVRWYSESEYRKMYPDEKIPETGRRKTQKEVFGFDEGYITIFKGDTYSNLEWFQQSIARYAKMWGWYIISTDTTPIDLPSGLTPVQLPWEMVGDEDGVLRDEKTVKTAVESLIFDASNSKFQGKVGDRLTLNLTVTAARTVDGYYGKTTIHTFEDIDDNLYVWSTGAKSWEVGKEVKIKGTVKEHKLWRNSEVTYLTRCTEVK